MARRNPGSSFSGQITAMFRQAVVSRLDRPASLEAWSPAINVYELRDRVEVCVDVAGVERDRLQVHVEPGRLRLEGARRPPEPTPPVKGAVRIVHMEIDDGPFRRDIPIPPNVQLDQVKSIYREGMLCVTLPLAVRPTRTRRT
ncbi:MAG: Hsp20/alpha crystallin family protein [Phycisphaeraceae bacterium]